MAFYRSKNKYRAKKVEKAGTWFDSKLESAVHDLLLLREKAGTISNIRVKHKIVFNDTDISWNIDFSFIDLASGDIIFCEAKGLETADYKIKKKLWQTHGHGVLEVWKGTAARPVLAETIITKPLKINYSQSEQRCPVCTQISPK